MVLEYLEKSKIVDSIEIVAGLGKFSSEFTHVT
jgi:hypothetical protein